jgi:hypothetical protein
MTTTTTPIPIRRRLTRVRRTAVLVLACLAGCNPASTRPAIAPFPEAKALLLTGGVREITMEIGGWLAAQSIHTEWVSAEDGYVESTWYDTDTRQSTGGTGSIGDLQVTVKIRCWVDPDAPGRSRLTVEAVYRPQVDPSRAERDLERPVPPGSGGAVLVQQLIDEMQRKFGGKT